MENTQGLGGYNGCFRVSALAQKVGGTEIKLFSILASIPDKGLSLELGNIMGRDKETEDIHVCNGDYGFTNTGAAVVEDYTFDITIGDDYATLINPVNGFQARDVFKAIVEGGTFNDGAGEKWTIVGTNGTSWIGTTEAIDGQAFGYLLQRDGMLRDPRRKDENGDWILKSNGRASSFNDTPLVMVEMNYRYSGSKSSGYRVPYALNTSNSFNEGSGAGINKHTLNFKRLSDVITIDKYLVYGISDADEVSTDAEIMNGIEADFIDANAGGTAPVGTPETGETAIAIDTADGSITVYEEEAGAWSEVTGLTFNDYVKLYGEDTDGDVAVVAVKDGVVPEVSTGQYLIKAVDFNYAEEKFDTIVK